MKRKLCIGMFGSCGNSLWREPFKEVYDRFDINYYDPKREQWLFTDAFVEAEYLAESMVVLIPITNETYSYVSLSEVGFTILNAVLTDESRDFVVMIDSDLKPELIEENPYAAKESLRARAIVKQHLIQLRLPNLYVVDSLDDMLEVSLVLYRCAAEKEKLKQYII